MVQGLQVVQVQALVALVEEEGELVAGEVVCWADRLCGTNRIG